MNTELKELEYIVRTIVTDQPWIIYFQIEAEVSGPRDEPSIELIEYGPVRFMPKCVSSTEGWEQYICEFINFDTLYEIFRKDDLDKVKLDVEETAIESYFSHYIDSLYEYSPSED